MTVASFYKALGVYGMIRGELPSLLICAGKIVKGGVGTDVEFSR